MTSKPAPRFNSNQEPFSDFHWLQIRAPAVTRCFWTATSLLLVGATLCSSSFAGSGGTVKVPMPMWGKRVKVKSGIIGTIDTRWTDGWGYRPIKITLSVRKSKRDRNLTIKIVPQCQGGPFGNTEPLSITAPIKIPQGEKSVTKTIYVPQQTPWFSLRAEFFEDNRKLKDLSMDWPVNIGRNYNTGSPSVLLVDRDAPKIDDDRPALIKKLKKTDSKNLPDAEKFEFLANNYYLQRRIKDEFFEDRGRATDDDSLTTVAELSNIEMLPPTDLPDQAIGLSGIDLLIIPLAELQDLFDNDPKRSKALDYFVRNGGNLVTFGEPALNELQLSVSELLKRELPFQKSNENLYPKETNSTFDELATDEDDDDYQTSRSKKKKARDLKDAIRFSMADHGLGRIVAVSSVDPYDATVADWQWLLLNIGTERLTWTDRHGISLVSNNNDYWDFMIPGFGASPVEGFLGVITLFILVIGPLNFFLLKKFKRLYYLPITVVAAALLTTITMMFYAVVSDGVKTRVRLRSFTLLDQQADKNVAMSQCRQSYLAAITPSAGLIFPDHTCVYPIVPFYDNSLERNEALMERTGKRALTRGYIRSRTTSQLLTTNVEETDLQIASVGEEKKNGLGVTLSHVWICDKSKNFYLAENVAPDQMMKLEPIDFKDAMPILNELVAENRPKPPEGLDKSSNVNMFGGNNWNRWGYAQSRPTYFSSALLQKRMNEMSNFFRKPRANSFMAISTEAPEFIHQGTAATEEAGFHVIRGGL